MTYSRLGDVFESRKIDLEYSSPYCEKFDQTHRLKAGDLSANLVSIRDYHDNASEWDICKSVRTSQSIDANAPLAHDKPAYRRLKYCSFDPRIEQSLQTRFYGTPQMPDPALFISCVLLPPKKYQWPSKYVTYPVPPKQAAIPWANLGLQAYGDLYTFNPRYPKNMHHFDAPDYDVQQERMADLAALYIPFGAKVRTMLEIGSGGGALSFALNKRYDVTVINTAFPDFPYCEYITERGGLCALIDSTRVMPFAKFSFDVIHHAWVFHSSTPDEWINILLEQNRLIRPGGYLWINDGFSYTVLKTIKFLLTKQLGYTYLYKYEEKKPSELNVTFGSIPYEVSWEAILVKPTILKKDLEECD